MLSSLSHCLVTGASGFIGRVLCETLRQKNIRVRALLREPQAGPWDEAIVFKDWSSIAADESTLLAALEGIDTVFHLAGIAHVPKKILKSDIPQEQYIEVNSNATIRLCRLAAKQQVKRFVFCSSVAAHTRAGSYGMSKYQAEQGLLSLISELDMHISIFRPVLVYGPHLKGNLLSMIKAIDKGWFPPIPETHNQRSMVAVQDVVSAAIACAENPKANGKIYTVSDEVPYSSRQLYDAIRAALGLKPRQWAIPTSLLEFPAHFSRVYRGVLNKLLGSECYSAALIKADLGWAPTTDFYKELKAILTAYLEQ